MKTNNAAGALMLVAAGVVSGCVPVPFIDAAHHECVDGALQRNPDPTVLKDAVERFEAGCKIGDPAACSLLGLMHERGLAMPVDRPRARELYEQACRAGNKIGCGHLRDSEAVTARVVEAFVMPPAPGVAKR